MFITDSSMYKIIICIKHNILVGKHNLNLCFKINYSNIRHPFFYSFIVNVFSVQCINM